MRCFSRHAVLSCTVLVGMIAGCGSTQSSRAVSDDQSTDGSIVAVLQRKAPSLLVTRASDGSIAIRLRGTTAYTGRETVPLYVLDGSPFQPGPGGALTGIDPYQIESIRFLRTAEAALYGIDGANGVILITTKRNATPTARE